MKTDLENLPKLLKQYLCYLTVIKNRSAKTVDAYAINLINFLKFLKKQYGCLKKDEIEQNEIEIKSINLNLIKKTTLMDIYEYLNHVSQQKNNSAKTRARKISSIKGFYKYLTFNLKLLKENPVEHLELPALKKSIPKYLTIEESLKLLETKSNCNSKTKFRDYCILTLFLNCGMRLSELVGINLKDLKIQEGSLKLLGKGNKERIVFLNKACTNSINNYLKFERNLNRKLVDVGALFVSIRTGKRIGARQIQKIVESSLNDAGLSNLGFSPHKLRHTAATLLYQYGKVDILILKELLGHANVGTTEIYTHISNDALKNAAIKNPLVNEKIKIKNN